LNPFFHLDRVGMRYGERQVLQDISLDFRAAELTAIAGPNGAGKSTLLGVMAGLKNEYSGTCAFAGTEVRKVARRQFARQVAVVPQSVRIEFPFTASQVVLMGRTPFGDRLFESEEDEVAVDDAMRLTDTLAFSDRDFRSLSGGEKQRVILASALAQSPKVLLLDEPTTFLDLRHQVGLYDLLRDLCAKGLMAICVTHDLNLAAAYCDRMLLLHDGKIVADGHPTDVVRRESIREVFSIDTVIQSSPSGRPWIHYGA
jgi:iron complex transport system ATP-binding protein